MTSPFTKILGGDRRWQLRLTISVPVLLILVTLAFGLVSYISLTAAWDDLDRLGAGEIASRLLRIHMIAMIALSAVATAVGLVLTATILRPVRAVVEAARQVALGRLDQRAPQLPAARELDDLSRAFNQMVENLNRSIAERNRGLSEHSGRADQLAALGTFTLGLAHELRNPLGAIKGLSQLLMLEHGLPARAADFLGRMNLEVDRVDAFIRQLFDLTEQPVACLRPTCLADVINRAGELARQDLAPEKIHSLKLETALEPAPPLLLEGDRLIQAFAKIIRNAYEAAPSGGTITLRAGRMANGAAPGWRVEVHNTGSVITPADQAKIFEPFFTTKARATGLGLTIARQIIIQNGGELEAAPDADGVSFIATFKNARPADPPAGGGA